VSASWDAWLASPNAVTECLGRALLTSGYTISVASTVSIVVGTGWRVLVRTGPPSPLCDCSGLQACAGTAVTAQSVCARE
jgi:hypothetical protein